MTLKLVKLASKVIPLQLNQETLRGFGAHGSHINWLLVPMPGAETDRPYAVDSAIYGADLTLRGDMRCEIESEILSIRSGAKRLTARLTEADTEYAFRSSDIQGIQFQTGKKFWDAIAVLSLHIDQYHGGVLNAIELKNGVMTATNGNTLASVDINTVPKQINCLLPGSSLKMLLPMRKELILDKAFMRISETELLIVLDSGACIAMHLIAGTYPRWQQLLPADAPEFTVKAHPKRVAEAIAAVKGTASKVTNRVQIPAGTDTLIGASDTQYSECGQGWVNPLKVDVHVSHKLYAACNKVFTGHYSIQCTGHLQPIVMRAPGSLALLMPIKHDQEVQQ